MKLIKSVSAFVASVSCALPLPKLLFSFDLVSPSSIHSRSLPCVIFAFYFFFLRQVFGTPKWEDVPMRKSIARAIEFGITLFRAAWFSVLAPECLTSLFYRVKFRRLCFHLLFAYLELPLFSNFRFSTWARFRRENAHADVFSIQELTRVADFRFFACFSFPEFRNSSFPDVSRSSNCEFQKFFTSTSFQFL